MTKTLYEFSNVSGNLLLIFWELVRKFDDLAEKLYEDFADDFNDYTESVIHIGFIGAGAREEVNFVVETSYPTGRPTDVKRTGRKVKSVPVSAFDETVGSRIEEYEKRLTRRVYRL